MSDGMDAFNFAWSALGARSGRMHINKPNMEQRERPRRATPLLENAGTVYDVSTLPPAFDGTRPRDHIVCCNPAIALCGADQRGEMFGIGAPDNKRMCSACAALSSDPHHKCCADCPGDAK